MIPPTSTFCCILIAFVTLVESDDNVGHLFRKLAEVKRKQGLDETFDTHKISYPIKHHVIKHVEVLPVISDYHSVNRERSSLIAYHPVYGPLHVKPLSKVSLSEVMNLHSGVAHL
ncbi:hypothetical protein OSTOST_18358, partial [Ostertagia ostertagi]